MRTCAAGLNKSVPVIIMIIVWSAPVMFKVWLDLGTKSKDYGKPEVYSFLWGPA